MYKVHFLPIQPVFCLFGDLVTPKEKLVSVKFNLTNGFLHLKIVLHLEIIVLVKI